MNLAREPGFRLGTLEVRPATRELIHPGGRESLEPRVMSVLIALARAKGEVVTRDDLSAQCWDGRIVSDDAINRVLSRIRKLSELTSGRDFTLETITKVGYRLVAAQAALQSDAPAEATLAPPPSAAAAMPAKPWIFATIAAIVAFVAGIVWWQATRPPVWNNDPTASLTLAVLPFDNLGEAPGDDVLAQGMSREIRNTLSRVRGLRVVSDSSSFAIAAEPLTSTGMGRRLQADILLDGSLERTGDTVKLTAELVDGWDGVNIWTGSQSGPAADLNRLRQQMAARVFEQMVMKIGPNRLERLAEPRVEDGRAYRLLVEANQLLESASGLRMRGNGKQALELGGRAEKLVEQALAIDAGSAMALTLKARIHAMAVTPDLNIAKLSVMERQAKSAEYLRLALASDPDYAPALGALGEYYRRYEWRWTTAESLLKRALALDPNQADTRVSYSYFLSGVGRCVEALEHARAGLEIDPEFGWRTLGVPRALKCLGRYDEAEAAYFDALKQDVDNPIVLREIYLIYLVRRDIAGLEAVRAKITDEFWNGAPPEDGQAWLDWTAAGIAAMRGENVGYADRIEQEIRSQIAGDARNAPMPLADILHGRVDLMWVLAVEFAFTGHAERAIAMLEDAVQGGTLYIPETMPGGQFEFTPEMRADPRYQAIWRNDPRLVELVNLRRQAVASGQMAGPDGLVVDRRS